MLLCLFFFIQIREEYERLQKEAEERRIQQKTNPKVTYFIFIFFFTKIYKDYIQKDCDHFE